MAYIFELDSELEKEPYVDALSTEIVEFALGYDPAANEAVLMSVMLVPTDDGICDLRFGIRDQDLSTDWRVSAPDYTREKVAKCIPSHARESVTKLIEKAVLLLASKTKFRKITMETYYADLPGKALAKYKPLCKALNTKGFQTENEFQDTDKKHYWLFNRDD